MGVRENLRDKAFKLVQECKFTEALNLLRKLIVADPNDWNILYLAGQCCRMLNDLDGAIKYLKKSSDINPNESQVWSALGIACQLKGKWDISIDALKKALHIDPDYVLAFNSLALTQKKMGELENADSNYTSGAMALTRNIVNGMSNLSENPIHQLIDSRNSLWTEYALNGSLHLAVNDGEFEGVAYPTGEMADEEDRTHEHEGLLWVDNNLVDGETCRLFLPNYFNTFNMALRVDHTYSDLMGNRSVVLDLLGKQDEAQKHLQEAEDFSR